MKGHRCIGTCIDPINPGVDMENRVRRWSVGTDWGEGKGVPVAGDNVII